MDFVCELLSQWKIVTQNFLLWEQLDFKDYDMNNEEKNILLQSMKKIMKDNIKWFISA